MRLVRKGQQIATACSRDGKEWESFAEVAIGWKGPVLVGVLAENTFREPFEATFDEYKLTVPEK